MTSTTSEFNIVEATIEDHKEALSSGRVTSVDLVVSYLLRIGTYDLRGGLNAFTVFNPAVFEEAAASDARRASRKPNRPLEGIPYTIKDSYKYQGLSVTNGSPALHGLQSSEDSGLAARLRAAGAVMIGKTNMPPMAAGGMQRGMYGRAESAYNRKYLTAAFSSGSSNGAATSLTTSMSCFGLGSETVSSGRSPGSNNALVVYTPSRGVLSCRGLWPLYVTCDVPVPYTRTVQDMLDLLTVIAEPDNEDIKGDFWKQQTHVSQTNSPPVDYKTLAQPTSLESKRIGIPKIYIGQSDSHPFAKPTVTSTPILALWETARADLEALGAEVIPTDFPLVTNYEDDHLSAETNNVLNAPSNWNVVERSSLIAKAWDEFLLQNNDPNIKSLADVDPNLLFPKPPDYLPDTFLEVRNWIHYSKLPELAAEYKDTPLMELPGLAQALQSLEAQRKRDLEDWMDEQGLDCIVFPAAGDVGLADLETNLESATHSLQNGVKYSHGNRAIRHLGVPTVSVPMGIMEERGGMPVNLTFAGKAYEDDKLLAYAYAFEKRTKRRVPPGETPVLETDKIPRVERALNKRIGLEADVEVFTNETGKCIRTSYALGLEDGGFGAVTVHVYLDGESCWRKTIESNDGDFESSFQIVLESPIQEVVNLGWDLKPLPLKPVMVLVVAKGEHGHTTAKLLWAERQ